MPGKLISLNKNNQEGESYPVHSLHFFIGSDYYCDLRIKNRNVSPQHCLVTSQKDEPALIRNLSRNAPTLVNGTEIGTPGLDVQLQDQDVITICNKHFKWQYDGLPSQSDKNINLSGKGRKSWPVFKNKLVAVVTPHRRDEEVEGTEKPKDIPSKKRRATYGGEKLNLSNKKTKVLGIKSGVKGSRRSHSSKKNIKVSPVVLQTNLTQLQASGRKSVKFADTVFHRQLGKRSKSIVTPYRPRLTPGREKRSVYFTPPSTLGSSRKGPTKGILKTPGSQSSESLLFRSSSHNISSSIPETTQNSSQNSLEVEESGLRTPPMDESDQPEVVMRSSKKSASKVVSSPEVTPKSASKKTGKRIRDDNSLKASERAAKKLKQDPPVAIDKKKMAALLQCHRKSLTPHPAVDKQRGRILLTVSSPKPSFPSSPLSTPKSGGRKPGVSRKSEPASQPIKIVPKALRFGSLDSSAAPLFKKKKKAPFKAINLDRKSSFGRTSVAKMLSSPSPPGKKMTRAMRAARASKEPVRKREATDVLSALDLSRKWPLSSESSTLQKSSSPIANLTNVSGIKELFSTEKTMDVRELFLEEGSEISPTRISIVSPSKGAMNNSTRQSRRSSVLNGSDYSTNMISSNSLNVKVAQEFSTTLPSLSLSSQNASTSRRSLSLKGVRSPQSQAPNESTSHSKKKSPSLRESVSSSVLLFSEPQSDESFSDFSLGSFNSSRYKISRNSSFSHSPFAQSENKKPDTQNESKIAPAKPQKQTRVSLRRLALSASTTEVFNMSRQELNTIANVTTIDLTRDSPERSLPLKKRSVMSVTGSSKHSRSLTLKEVSSRAVALTSPSQTIDSSVNKSKNKGRHSKSLTSPNTKDSHNSETSCLSSASLKVHAGTVRENVMSDLNSVEYSFQNTGHGSNKISLNSSPRISESAKKPIMNETLTFNSRPTRSSFSIHLDLFKLDKIPRDIPSSTPLKIRTPKNSIAILPKKTRSKSAVNINLFNLDGLTKPSKLHRSLRRFIVPHQKRVSKSLSLKGNLEDSTEKKPANSSLKILSKKKSAGKENQQHVSHSTVNNDLSDADDSSNLIINRQLKRKSFRSKSLERPKEKPHVSIKTSKSFQHLYKKDLTLRNSDHLYEDILPTEHIPDSNATPPNKIENKSTRSRSTVNIDLFKLDDKPANSSLKVLSTKKSAGKENQQKWSLLTVNNDLNNAEGTSNLTARSPLKGKSFRSKSLERCKGKANNVSINSSASLQQLNEKDKSVSVPDNSYFEVPNAECTPKARVYKSTRSISSVDIDLFKLDDKPANSSLKILSKNISSAKKNHPNRSQSTLNNDLSNDDNSSKLLASSPLKAKSLRSKSLEGSKGKHQSLPSSRSLHFYVSVLPTEYIPDANVNKYVTRKSTPHNKIENKTTRSRSSVKIDLFKLDDKPANSPLKVLSTKKSTGKETQQRRSLPIVNNGLSHAEDPSNLTASSPLNGVSFRSKFIGSPKEIFSNVSIKSSKSFQELYKIDPSFTDIDNTHSVDTSATVSGSKVLESSSTSSEKTENKSTRSRSSVNIDIFKLDDSKNLSKSLSKDKSLKRKSLECVTEMSFNLSGILQKQALLSGKHISLLEGTNTSKGLTPKGTPMSTFKNVPNRSKLVTLPPEDVEYKSTRGQSTVNTDLFKLEDSPKLFALSSSKSKLFRSKSADAASASKVEDGGITKRPLIKNTPHKGSLTLVSSTPIVNKSTRSTGQISIDLFKLDDHSPLSESVKFSKRKSEKSSLPNEQILLSPFNKHQSNEPPNSSISSDDSSRKSDKKNLPVSKQKNYFRNMLANKLTVASDSSKNELSVQKSLNKELSEFSQNVALPSIGSERRPTRSNTSADINLFKLDNSPGCSKKGSTSFQLKNYSPRVLLTPFPKSRGLAKMYVNYVNNEQNSKGTQTQSPKIIGFSCQQTQTSARKITKTPLAEEMQLTLLNRIAIANFANNTTPVCDYQMPTNVALSPKVRSLRQKEMDESQRSPKTSTNDKTPLTALSPKGRRSLTGRLTPLGDSIITEDTVNNDTIKVTGKVTKRNKVVESKPSPSSSIVKKARYSKKPITQKSRGSLQGKTVLPETKPTVVKRGRKQKVINLPDVLNPSGNKKNVQQPTPSPKVVALKVAEGEFTKLSSPIVKVSPPKKRTRANALRSEKPDRDEIPDVSSVESKKKRKANVRAEEKVVHPELLEERKSPVKRNTRRNKIASPISFGPRMPKPRNKNEEKAVLTEKKEPSPLKRGRTVERKQILNNEVSSSSNNIISVKKSSIHSPKVVAMKVVSGRQKKVLSSPILKDSSTKTGTRGKALRSVRPILDEIPAVSNAKSKEKKKTNSRADEKVIHPKLPEAPRSLKRNTRRNKIASPISLEPQKPKSRGENQGKKQAVLSEKPEPSPVKRGRRAKSKQILNNQDVSNSSDNKLSVQKPTSPKSIREKRRKGSPSLLKDSPPKKRTRRAASPALLEITAAPVAPLKGIRKTNTRTEQKIIHPESPIQRNTRSNKAVSFKSPTSKHGKQGKNQNKAGSSEKAEPLGEKHETPAKRKHKKLHIQEVPSSSGNKKKVQKPIPSLKVVAEGKNRKCLSSPVEKDYSIKKRTRANQPEKAKPAKRGR